MDADTIKIHHRSPLSMGLSAPSRRDRSIPARSRVVTFHTLDQGRQGQTQIDQFVFAETLQRHEAALLTGATITEILKSRSSHWPKGLANRSGMVGRNLIGSRIEGRP